MAAPICMVVITEANHKSSTYRFQSNPASRNGRLKRMQLITLKGRFPTPRSLIYYIPRKKKNLIFKFQQSLTPINEKGIAVVEKKDSENGSEGQAPALQEVGGSFWRSLSSFKIRFDAIAFLFLYLSRFYFYFLSSFWNMVREGEDVYTDL